MRYYVIINGVSSETIQGLAIESLPAISKPLQRSKQETIDGRDGDIITKLGYSAYDKTLKIGLWGNYDINEVIKYFDTEGTITFSNEPDMYYNFNILNRIDFINQLEAFRKATITIHCQPFKYKEEETETLELEEHQATGTDFNLDGTYATSLGIDLKGNTSQVQLSGKNLFNPIIVNNGTAIYTNNCTVATNNGVITLTATASGTLNFGTGRSSGGNYTNDRGVKIPVEASTKYQITLSNSNFTRCYINYYTSANVSLGGTSLYLPNTEITTNANASYMTVSLIYENAVSGTTYSTTVQVEKGSTPTNYEQYCGGTPSPNPSYPQDIHNVSGNNEIVVCGKNLFDKSNYNYVNAYFNSSTTQYLYSNANSTTIYIPCKPNTTYTIQKVSGQRFAFGYTKETPTINTSVYGTVGGNSTATSYTITTGSEAKYLVSFVLNVNVSGEPTLQQVLDSIQIEEGSTATTYEAYNGTTYNINLPVENLFDKNDTNIIDNYYLLSDGTTSESTNFYITDYIVIQPNTTYTLSPYRNYSAYECFYDKDKTFISSIKISDITPSFTTPSNCKYIRLSIRKYDVDEEQLEKGSKPNTYTPYGTTPIELCKIGTYQDYFYKEDDKWYLHKEIGKVVFNGSEDETWTDSKISGYTTLRFRCNLGVSIVNFLGYCDKFSMRTGSAEDVENCYNTTAQVYLSINPSRLSGTSVDDFKTWLSSNNVIDYYALATSTNTEITDTTLIEQLNAIKEAQTYTGTTNILQTNNDLPFILDIDYFTGTNEITITNNGNTYSKPVLTLVGSGVIGIYLNDSQIFQVSLGTDETIIIDINNMEAYYDATLKNRQVIGDYNNFRLIAGENKIKLTGNWDKLSVDNYSRWI